MTSNSLPWRQHVRHDVKIRHEDKRFVITSKSSPWRQQDVITPKSLSWRHKICHDVKNIPNVCHEIKNTSWCQKVCHDVKRFVMVNGLSLLPKTKPSLLVKKFYHTKKTRRHKVRHNIKNTSWRLRFVMKSKGVSWHEKHVMTSKSLL